MKNREHICTFRDGSLKGDSFRSKTVDDLLEEDYDLAIFVSSWEERCACFASSDKWSADATTLVLFDDRDGQGLRERHDELLRTKVMERSNHVTVVAGRSIDVESVWEEIFSQVLATFEQKKRPLKILLDSTTCPRFHVLAIVGACMAEGIASTISVTYAEGRYPDQSCGRNGPEEITFTDGHWKAIAVPYYEGAYSPSKKRFYLVSVGFEGWKTLRVVSRADPDRVSVLFPNPGFQTDYAERTRTNDDLIRQYCIPAEQIVDAVAGDAIGAWKALSFASLERIEKENTYFLCCGTKPHSLALGLRAMALGTPAVLYNLPQNHSVLPVVSNGVFWRYDIRSVTVPERAGE